MFMRPCEKNSVIRKVLLRSISNKENIWWIQLKPVGERFVNIRCKVSNAIYDGESSRFYPFIW